MEREETCSSSHAAHSSITAIAGAYTGPLLEHLYGKGQKTCDMEDIYEALNALYETDRVEEAMGLIRGLFAIGEMDYPYPLEALERFRSAREAFVSEFLAGFQRKITERRKREKCTGKEGGRYAAE